MFNFWQFCVLSDRQHGKHAEKMQIILKAMMINFLKALKEF